MDDLTKRYPTRDEIEKAADRPWRDVPTPELGEGAFVRVGTLSAAELLAFDFVRKDAPREAYPGLLLARVVIDPVTGARLFTDEDAAWLNAKSWKWVGRVYGAAADLNGLTDTAVEAAAKN